MPYNVESPEMKAVELMRRKRTPSIANDTARKRRRGAPAETSFADIVRLIEEARSRTYQLVNTELVGL